MKTLTQLSAEELEAFEKELSLNNADILNAFQLQGTADMPMIAYDERVCLIPAMEAVREQSKTRFKSWLLAHDRRIIEVAFAATEVETRLMYDDMPDPENGSGFNAALSEVNKLKQEFLK